MPYGFRMALGKFWGALAAYIILCTFAVSSTFGSPLLLFATRKDIRVANVSRSNKVGLIVKDLTQGAALDFFWERRLVCWSDSELEIIQCVKTNGSTPGERFTVINSKLLKPDGLACDWYTGKLYWTDLLKKTIEVTNIDGEPQRKVLFWTEIFEPRAIILVPMRSLMFWTDWGDSPKIEKAAMDGDPDSRETIVHDDIFWPNALTADYENELLYWADGRLKFIAVVDYSGKNRRTIIKEGVDYPYAITFFDQKLYWTDWSTWCIHSHDLRSTGSQSHPRELLHGEYIPGDIEVWDPKRQPYADNPCRHNNGNCSHLCLLSLRAPGYTCACPTGIKLINNLTCADRPENLLLIVQKKEMSRLSLDSPDYTDVVLPLTGIKWAIAVDFDPVDEMFYWTDQGAHAIRRAYLNGTGQEDLITKEIINPEGIAIDWIARNMYWTDSDKDRIQVARLNGTNRKVLINEDLMNPRAIAVAPQLGWMFWTDWSVKKPKIERSNLDGSERMLIITKGISWPNGIALDLDRRKVYWCDAKTDKIEVCNMDGTDRREIITDDLPHLFGLSILGDYLYWTDWQKRSVERAHKITGANREIIMEPIPDIMGVKALKLGKTQGTNPCGNNNGGCSHLCLNKPGNNYICACQIGYELKKDKKTCVIPDAFLLFSRKDNIGRISIENANNDNIIPVTGVKDASALDFDISQNRIYWADVKLKTISRAFINGSEAEKVVDLGLESPEGLAFDWIARNLYWSDTSTQRIELVRLEDNSRKVLIWQDLIEPRCLALDPRHGHMYWSEWGKSGSIERANLDGSERQVVLSSIGRTHGLTIDHELRRLYWADLLTPAIVSYDLKTSNRKSVITRNIVYPFSLTQHLDYIYWTDWNTGNVERANKTTGANRTKIHDKLESVTSILVFHESRQAGSNGCKINNGGCSHICIALSDTDGNFSHSHKCTCPTHFNLGSDNKTCIAPRNFMIYSTRNLMGRYLPDADDCPDVVMKIQGLRNIKSIDLDPITQHIYWIDGRSMSIRKTLENRTHASVIISGGNGFHPFDLALDPLGRLLFWSCTTNDAINVTRLDNGSALGVVVKGEGEKPRNIAVHPEKRLLFWTDVGEKMKVIQSAMDGKDRITIATDLNQPTSLAIDTISDLIFWAHGHQIEVAELGGNGRRVLISIDELGAIAYLAVFNEYIYWFNRESQIVERVNVTSGLERQSVLNRLVTDFITVRTPEDLVMESHVCSPFQDYGGCSHFCIGTESPAKCSCPQYLVLSEDRRVCSAVSACRADHFTCADSGSSIANDCIPVSWKCDGQTDCADGSDELGCPSCARDQFRCQSGQCIDNSWVCDGIVQCQDGGDEAHCCQPGQFRCTLTSVCIAGNTLCDGWDNCADGSDESPAVCSPPNRRDMVGSAGIESGKSAYIIAILVVVGVVTTAVLGFYYCRKKLAGSEELPDILHDSAGDPLSPKPGRSGKPTLVQKNGSKDHKNGLKTVRMSTLTGSIGSGYDRSHITGASSSTRGSSGGVYPQETLNPPPSPATTANSTRCSSSNASRYRPYRHYRSINQPPPPTPCSTDVCDESDCNYPTRYRYESEPFPPPPTPRSVYHSDAGISCPPSPSSRSSTYFSPLPPPPSPVP
ncbi:low-density lipoprotein receptor-related protein 6 [Microplitis mediator]|uniref:low-density lipoprotein receptor-related protein 6 n=1 Tax=Microplitis mediator TaxID=375433 RepID=UPI002557B43A|nr:low-density lipoprotein receptor-related protein 6 [Microplitis mediator]XP_057340652.1 low-density lipoprotein receptor-related protein 6 [Microplitis mediator]